MKPDRKFRLALALMFERAAHLVRRELCDNLTRPELADLLTITGDALAVAAEFNADHPRQRPFSGDELIELIALRSEVRRRLKESYRPSRRKGGDRR